MLMELMWLKEGMETWVLRGVQVSPDGIPRTISKHTQRFCRVLVASTCQHYGRDTSRSLWSL